METLNKIKASDFYNNYYIECMYKEYNILYCHGVITITKNKAYKGMIECNEKLADFKNTVRSYCTLILH